MIFHILIQLCVCLSVCWCLSDCVCGSLVGKNYACGIETFSCSVSDPTTVILVRKKMSVAQLHFYCYTNRAGRWRWSVFVFWRVEGITALIELPKNYIAAAMDKKISKSTKYGADEQISRLKMRYLKQNIPLSLQWSTAWQFLLIPLCQWLRSAACPTTRIRSELLSTSMVSLKLGVSVWFLSCKETAFLKTV